MKPEYIEGQRFDKIDFTVPAVARTEYEHCTFTNCDFSNADLSGSIFISCAFAGCNLSLAKLSHTVFNDVTFKDCKMLGLQFGECNAFVLLFTVDQCMLDHSSFYKLKLKKMTFKNSKLEEVDFTNTDLSGSVFDNCDLTRATFDSTILERTDFRTSYNYSIDPERNRIKKAKFSLPGIAGLLDKYDIVIAH